MPLRVVTYSLAVIERLAGRGDLTLVQLGGTFDARGRRYSGMLTESALRLLKVDRFFFSGAGLDPAQGISEPNPDQARLKRMMLAQAAWSGALIDHSKFGIKADHYFATPADFDVVVADHGAKAYAKTHLKESPYELKFAR
jgi:DeoR/GlpR family transcriptional regulator of sugar metabolism